MTSLATIFFLSGAREYLIIVGLLALGCSLALVVFLIAVYHWAGPSRGDVPERLRMPREPLIDLGKERDDYERRREAREEDEQLRRIA